MRASSAECSTVFPLFLSSTFVRPPLDHRQYLELPTLRGSGVEQLWEYSHYIIFLESRGTSIKNNHKGNPPKNEYNTNIITPI
jgi:hypothetical protein